MKNGAFQTHICCMNDGVELYVEIHGDQGPPIVFIPGLGDNHLSWKTQVEGLSNHYRVVLIDNRGAGNSSTPLSAYPMEQMADDAHEVVRMLGLAPVSAVGASMGGAVCQYWASRNPDDIERIVISSTWGAPDTFIVTLFNHWRGLAERGDRLALIESLLLFCYSPNYLRLFPETAPNFIEGETMNLQGFALAAQACGKHNFLNTGKIIEQPTLLIIGEHDILIRPSLSHALTDMMKEVQIVTMQTGHMTYWEKPDIFNDLIRSFVV